MGNYRIPKKNSNATEEERKRQRLRDTRNLATGIEIALKNLLPNESKVVKKAVWNTHDSLAVDIELGVDSSRTEFLGARIVDRATSNGQTRGNGGLVNGRRKFAGVPIAPRAMIKHWSVFDQGKAPDHSHKQGPQDPNGQIGVSRASPPTRAPNSNDGESPSDASGRTTHPYLQDPSDPNRLIGVPRPRLPSWAGRPDCHKSSSENPIRTSYPYLQDPSDPDKFVGVPRPFDWKDQSTVSDHYTGPAFYDHRRRQIELGVVPSIYPDYWINGQTFGDDDKDIFSAKRLHEKEREGMKSDAAGGPLDGVDRDGDVVMMQGQEINIPTAQEPEIVMPTPVRILPTPANSACGSLIQVFDGFRIEDDVVLETAETVKARQKFFAELESDETPIEPVNAPAASEGRSGGGEISSLVDLGDSKASDTASTSMVSRISAKSSTNALLSARIEKMQPYRTSSVAGSSYAPTASSGASDFDGPHKSRLGTPSQRSFGRNGTSNHSTASKAPSTVFSYAGSSGGRNCPFDTMFDAVLAHAIDIPVLEPTPALKSSLFAGHAANLRVPMSHNEKVSQWAASVIPSGNSNGQPPSPGKPVPASKAPVEFIFPRNRASGAKTILPTRKPNNTSSDLLEMGGREKGDMHPPPNSGKS
ncbi:unnamed protein product [Tuber aestivum]|uniref:Uncharacterized protein n=1 Tax=Tuber aestivum TaxID=59557 RepID=A0A292Q5I0_9PEZI|nr:unnamed protein product [Tuber aestivum]